MLPGAHVQVPITNVAVFTALGVIVTVLLAASPSSVFVEVVTVIAPLETFRLPTNCVGLELQPEALRSPGSPPLLAA